MHRFAARAGQAVNTVLDQHGSPMYLTGLKVPWKQGIDPAKLSLTELRVAYRELSVPQRPAMIEYVWSRQDIAKRERLQFLVDILEQE